MNAAKRSSLKSSKFSVSTSGSDTSVEKTHDKLQSKNSVRISDSVLVVEGNRKHSLLYDETTPQMPKVR